MAKPPTIANSDKKLLKLFELLKRDRACQTILSTVTRLKKSDIELSAQKALEIVFREIARKKLLGGEFTNTTASKTWPVWRKDEVEELIKLHKHRAAVREISRLLCRTEEDVAAKLCQLGFRPRDR